MTRFSDKFRKGVRRFFIFLGVAAVSLIFAACYGPAPMPDDWENDGGSDTESQSKK